MSDEEPTGEVEIIRKWFSSKGYPVEFETARTLRHVGFQTTQGNYFVDERDAPATVREIDVVATVAGSEFVRVVVECKRPGQPWVVMTDAYYMDPHSIVSSLVSGRRARNRLLARVDKVLKSGNPLPDYLAQVPRFGFAIEEAAIKKSSKPDDDAKSGPYFALQKVAAAGEAISAQGEVEFKHTVCLLLLVVDGPLYQLGFDEEGKEILESVVWQRVFWRGSSGRPTCIDVVRLENLEPRARVLFDGVKQLHRAIELEDGKAD